MTTTTTTTTPSRSGRVKTLADWFSAPVDVSGPDDDFVREEVLNDLYAVRAWACSGDLVAVCGREGRGLLERVNDLVTVDYQRDDRWGRVRFWMNASSLSDFGARLRALPDLRTDVDSVFLGSV